VKVKRNIKEVSWTTTLLQQQHYYLQTKMKMTRESTLTPISRGKGTEVGIGIGNRSRFNN